MTTEDSSGRKVSLTRRRCLGFLAVILSAGLAPAASAYSAAVALVTDVSGTTNPPLSIHREVAPGTRIVLGPGARVSLLHYATCTIVMLKGGTATVTDQGVDVNVANVESTKPGPCPRLHRISHEGPGPLGGVVVTRGSPGPLLKVAPDVLVVLAGTGAAEAVSADVLDGNLKAVGGPIPIRKQSFSLNSALVPKRVYVLRITFKGRSDPVEVPVSISPAISGGMLVLQLE